MTSDAPVSTVLHIVVAGDIGGAERMLVDLAKSESERHVVFLRASSPELLAFFRDEGVSIADEALVRETPLAYLTHALGERLVGEVKAVARRVAADVVQLHTIGSHVPGSRAAIGLNLPFVRTEHSTRAYDDVSVMALSRWSLARAARVVCVSEHVANVARRAAPDASKVRVVPNGVDLERFAVESPPTAGPEMPFTFALVGRLEPRKGVDVALDALALVPGARLRIVGDGPSRVDLEAYARRVGVRDRATFVGRVGDVRGELRLAHAVLSSSRKEALGLALLEGMAMGRPAVASPTGGVPEFVREETGYLAVDGSAVALARAMRDAMSAPRDELAQRGSAAADLVRARYSLLAMREGYRAVYAELTRASR